MQHKTHIYELIIWYEIITKGNERIDEWHTMKLLISEVNMSANYGLCQIWDGDCSVNDFTDLERNEIAKPKQCGTTTTRSTKHR
jgi:hypothetical protein